MREVVCMMKSGSDNRVLRNSGACRGSILGIVVTTVTERE